MREATITLGGVEYTIAERPHRKQREWKEQLRAEFGPLVEQFVQATELMDKTGKEMSELIGTFVLPLLAQIDDATEKAANLVISYSPVLEADRARIEAEAFDSELALALVDVVKLAYPFGSLGKTLLSLTG